MGDPGEVKWKAATLGGWKRRWAQLARIFLVAVAVLLGALVGSCLTVLAWRIAESAQAANRSSPNRLRSFLSDVPVMRLLRRRNVIAGNSPGVAVRPPILELVTAALFGVMALKFGLSWVLAAYLYLAAMAVVLTVVDLQHQRLPNAIVIPSGGAGVLLLAIGALGEGSWSSLLRAVVGAGILFLVFLLLAVVSPAGIGMGDVKLAAVLGLFLGYLGWYTLIWGAAGSFVVSALVAVALLLVKKVHRGTLLPFGPFMLATAVAVVLIFAR